MTTGTASTASSAPVNQLINKSIYEMFRDAVRVSLQNPALALFMLRMLRKQQSAARRREIWLAEGLEVPSFLIVSVTRRCNLHCKGCYARAQHRADGAELTESELRNLFDQARELGISIVLLAGGEPFSRPDLLTVTKEYPDLMFAVFTNGLLLDEATAMELARQRHVVPVISFEGNRQETDDRRGAGVFARLLGVTRELRRKSIFFGASLTVTSENFATVTATAYLESLLATGCKLFFFVEYVPVEPSTDSLALAPSQRAQLPALMARLRKTRSCLSVAFPGDEEAFGGCLAAGRGFVHVSPEGSLEPCPFAPYSDANVRTLPLKEALKSRLLSKIRESHHLLEETSGGCALWANRDWVRSLLPDDAQSKPVDVEVTR